MFGISEKKQVKILKTENCSKGEQKSNVLLGFMVIMVDVMWFT